MMSYQQRHLQLLSPDLFALKCIELVNATIGQEDCMIASFMSTDNQSQEGDSVEYPNPLLPLVASSLAISSSFDA